MARFKISRTEGDTCFVFVQTVQMTMQFPGVPIINDKLSIMQTTDLTIFHVEWILLSSA